jgi:ABC-type Na+ efflux pump permease subunit
MNKKIWLIIVIVIIVAGGLYLVLGKNKEPNKETAHLADDTQVAPTKSLKDLVLQGKAMKCSFKNDNSQGTFYVADQKVRGDISAVVNGKDFKNHTVIMDKTSYTWLEGEKTGFKMTASENTTPTENLTPEQKQETVNMEAKMNYTCVNWNKDNSYFELPKDVSFSDLSSLIPSAKIIPSTKVDCSICDKLPEANRAQCKTSLGCK